MKEVAMQFINKDISTKAGANYEMMQFYNHRDWFEQFMEEAKDKMVVPKEQIAKGADQKLPPTVQQLPDVRAKKPRVKVMIPPPTHPHEPPPPK